MSWSITAGSGDGWVERCQVVLDPPHGGQLGNVGVERVDEGPGEHPWGGLLGPGSRCGPPFVCCDGSIGVGVSRWQVGCGVVVERDRLLGQVHLRILGA